MRGEGAMLVQKVLFCGFGAAEAGEPGAALAACGRALDSGLPAELSTASTSNNLLPCPRAAYAADSSLPHSCRLLFQINLSVYNKPMVKKAKEYTDYHK